MRADVLQPEDYAADRDLPRIAWTPASTDLHLNLVILTPGEEIGAHVNQTLDVVLTTLAGNGTLVVDDEPVPLQPGTIALIPQGASRHVVAGDNGLRYITCHRKRGGIMPTLPPTGKSTTAGETPSQ